MYIAKGGKIMKYIILLILGIISIVISLITRKTDVQTIQMKSAFGTITNIIYSDAGNVRYYINIKTDDGQLLEAQSIYYSKTNRKYHEEDIVPVNYYITKNNDVRCEVNDQELVPCKDSFKSVSKITLIVGIVLIALFVVFVVKNFF